MLEDGELFMKAARLIISGVSLVALTGAAFLFADQKPANGPQTGANPRETVAKPLSEKEKKRKEEKLRKELETPYRKWLSEDVAYIITDEEREAFKRMQSDE